MEQMMAEDRQGMFLFAKDVQEILGVSRNYAYYPGTERGTGKTGLQGSSWQGTD